VKPDTKYLIMVRSHSKKKVILEHIQGYCTVYTLITC
jgi:hypothetical protein